MRLRRVQTKSPANLPRPGSLSQGCEGRGKGGRGEEVRGLQKWAKLGTSGLAAVPNHSPGSAPTPTPQKPTQGLRGRRAAAV